METYVLNHQAMEINGHMHYHATRGTENVIHHRNMKWFAVVQSSGNIHPHVYVSIRKNTFCEEEKVEDRTTLIYQL